VTSTPDPVRGEAIVAHVVLREGATPAALRRYCGSELPRFMQPARIDARSALPLNAAGKLDYLALAAAARVADAPA